MKFIFLTIDGNHGPALREAAGRLHREHGVDLTVACYDAATLRDEEGWRRLERDVAGAAFVFGARLFGEEYVRPLERILGAATCPVLIITSNPALIRQTRVGKFSLARRDEGEGGLLSQWIKKLRPQGGVGEARRQLAVLRNLSKVLRLIPGKARDLYTYIVAHQYWLNSSPENLYRMLCLLVDGYVPGRRSKLPLLDPLSYPDTALFHPDAPEPFESLAAYEKWRQQRTRNREPRTANRELRTENREPRTENRESRTENREPRTENREPRTANREPRTENREPRTENREPRTENREPRTENREPRTENREPRTANREPRTKTTGAAVPGSSGVVGILALRTVVLSGNTGHLAALVRALEARGIEARLAYASGLDMRPAVEAFFTDGGRRSTVDLLVNASGFALVGGPAESRPAEARAALETLDVGYMGLIPLSFQRVDDWRADAAGLAPVQSALSVAVPELEGAADPLVYGGPGAAGDSFAPLPAEIEQIAGRIARRVALRRASNAEKRLALILFSFPPNLGNVGTAAYLDVFASLYNLLAALKADGYSVELPASADELRRMVVEGNALANGTDANLADRFPKADYMRLFPAFSQIEPFWGRAPGALLNDGKAFQILGRQLGNIFVGVQPSFGYERDPMRLLMAKDAAPNHAFAAFYTWLRHSFRADAVVHMGTHGALEFMPGKQVGLSADCWPYRLIGDLPNFYYYSVNNPSEAAIAKRRSGATLVSYLVPPLQQAGLYKGLRALKDTLDRYRQRPDPELLEDIRVQAEKLGMQNATCKMPDAEGVMNNSLAGNANSEGAILPSAFCIDQYLAALSHELLQIEQRMIPAGLHIIGRPPAAEELVDFLALSAAFRPFRARDGKSEATLHQLIARSLGYDYAALRDRLGSDFAAQLQWQEVEKIAKEAVRRFVAAAGFSSPHGQADDYLKSAAGLRPDMLTPLWASLGELLRGLLHDGELPGLLRALRGGFVSPSPSNDVVRDPAVVPTGRNVFSLDPYRVPTPAAMERARRLVNELLARPAGESSPESIAVVLWGSDNLKSDCEGVAQVLALFGARPVPDELGNISSVELLPLAELGRPRVDVVVTVSGIFRDLLGSQMRLIDQAARLAALADEPLEQNLVRRNALRQAAELGVSLEEAAIRVFANAPGSYGANVNHMVESGTWEDDDQLSSAFLSRKSFTLAKDGQWRESRALMERALATVDLTFQNVDSFEVGISDIDNYYESLGGVTKSVESLRGKKPPVLVADAISTTAAGRVSSLEQAVRLETRAKLLNPKWYEAMLAHGYEGVREIEARVNNTYGWSATANAVEDWVYQGVAETFVLDEAMRQRLTAANPHAAIGVARRLLEANGRGFWDADEATLEQLRAIYADLEDRLEGISV